MILVTRLDGSRFYVNPDLIQTIERTPDTIITLTNNTKIVVKEKAESIVTQFIEYQQMVRKPFTEK